METFALIYCDGACSGNPGPGGWGAITVSSKHEVRELGGARAQTTNNQMELTGAIEALRELASETAPIYLYTDSTYVIRGITEWIWGWKRKGWTTAEGKPVVNRELWEKLEAQVKGRKIDWRYVPGHAGVPGNERVDQIAVDFAAGMLPPLFRGPAAAYSTFDLKKLPAGGEVPKKKAGPKTKETFTYLSLVGRAAKRHKTWDECQARVKGVSGAKYKKVKNADEEAAVLADWGVKLD